MAKIMFIGDMHLGHRNGDKETAEYQMQIFDDFIFPLIKKFGIKYVLQSGDFFDARKAIRHDTMELVRERFIPKTAGVEWHVIVGNHDMHLKESIFPNSCNELLANYENFTIYNEPTVLTIDGFSIDMIPWICRDNRKSVLDFIANSTRQFALGHFELAGFQYYKGMASQGEDAHFLSNYNRVLSGHFHTMSKSNHIQYIGTPYQLTYGDADDDRGVWVYDTDTGEFEFHNNNMPRYTRIYFDHSVFDQTNLERFTNMYITIQVKSRGDSKKFDKLVDKLVGIAKEVKVKDTLESDVELDTEQLGDLQTIGDIMDVYVDALDETDPDRDKIKKFLAGLLAEAESV